MLKDETPTWTPSQEISELMEKMKIPEDKPEPGDMARMRRNIMKAVRIAAKTAKRLPVGKRAKTRDKLRSVKKKLVKGKR